MQKGGLRGRTLIAGGTDSGGKSIQRFSVFSCPWGWRCRHVLERGKEISNAGDEYRSQRQLSVSFLLRYILRTVAVQGRPRTRWGGGKRPCASHQCGYAAPYGRQAVIEHRKKVIKKDRIYYLGRKTKVYTPSSR